MDRGTKLMVAWLGAATAVGGIVGGCDAHALIQDYNSPSFIYQALAYATKTVGGLFEGLILGVVVPAIPLIAKNYINKPKLPKSDSRNKPSSLEEAE